MSSTLKALETLTLKDKRAASVRIWRGTSRVTGNDAFLTRLGNQSTLSGDKETIFENQSLVRDPSEVTELNHVGYSGERAAWAWEQEGLSVYDINREEGKLCQECGQYHTKSFTEGTRHDEWNQGLTTCICC